jgi:8-oxo-dGTP pyrophosphatase MutT (NUDIX family)
MGHRADLPAKRAAGCVVYRHDGGALLVLLIRDKYGRWTLPKGHIEPGESEEQAAAREVFEETAVAGVLGPLVGRIAYTVMKNGQPRAKQVAFFLLRVAGGRAVPQAEEGIVAAEWFTPDAALALIGYEQVREVLARAIKLLREK